MKVCKEIGQEGSVQSDERPNEYLDRLAFRESRAHSGGQVPDRLDGQSRKASKDHETNFSTKDALDEMLKVLDAKAGTHLEGKETSTERDTKEGGEGTGHSHECVFPNNVGRGLAKDPTRDKTTESTTNCDKRCFRSQGTTGCQGMNTNNMQCNAIGIVIVIVIVRCRKRNK